MRSHATRLDAELPLHHPARIVADCKAVLANPDLFLEDCPAVEVAWHALHLLRLLGDERAIAELGRPWVEFTDGNTRDWTEEQDRWVASLSRREAASLIGCSMQVVTNRRRALRLAA